MPRSAEGHPAGSRPETSVVVRDDHKGARGVAPLTAATPGIGSRAPRKGPDGFCPPHWPDSRARHLQRAPSPGHASRHTAAGQGQLAARYRRPVTAVDHVNGAGRPVPKVTGRRRRSRDKGRPGTGNKTTARTAGSGNVLIVGQWPLLTPTRYAGKVYGREAVRSKRPGQGTARPQPWRHRTRSNRAGTGRTGRGTSILVSRLPGRAAKQGPRSLTHRGPPTLASKQQGFPGCSGELDSTRGTRPRLHHHQLTVGHDVGAVAGDRPAPLDRPGVCARDTASPEQPFGRNPRPPAAANAHQHRH